jgi:HAD superfamily hydrolase (TIGR01509 family)
VSPIECIFLDDGGVLNDNSLRGPQWQRLVGEFFVPRLGGTHEQWAAANERILGGFFERMVARWQAWDEAFDDYARLCEDFDGDWLSSMCAEVGVAPPPNVASQAQLAREASAYIEPKVHASFPGVAETLHLLSQDYVLYMASTGASWELEHRLSAIGVRKLFKRLYGPDLVNLPKVGRRYYERVFEHAGIDPARALVVDDKAEFLDHAASLGARTVHVSAGESSDTHQRIAALAELSSLLNLTS